MIFRVRHTTEYVYRATVALCHNVVHLRPRDTERQQCVEHELQVDPDPMNRRDGEDFYGNPVSWFSLQEQHRKFTVTSVSTVEVTSNGGLAPQGSLAWEEAARQTERTLDACEFCFDSPHVPTDRKLREYAQTSFTLGRPVAEGAVDLMRRINKDFKFVSGVTNVGTPVLDVLRDRRGVCQDFTHLIIGCLRSTGLAARYVSGYLLTYSPPGKPRLVGADASHAWASVYIPNHGWLDLDPTNDCIPDDKHVTVGWARDYGDIAPVQGVIVGGHQHSLKVSVDVAPVSEDGDVAETAPSIHSPGMAGEGRVSADDKVRCRAERGGRLSFLTVEVV